MVLRILILSAALSWLFPLSSWADSAPGRLVGRVVFSGTPPTPQHAQVTRDAAFCRPQVPISSISVHADTHGLQGAIVSVEGEGPPGSSDRPSPAVLTNHGCAFRPRVVAAQEGAALEIHNDDPVMHNTHVSLGAQTFVNVALVPQGRPIEKPIKRFGHYTVKCDAHKFMTATLMVFPHSRFAVTDEAGDFRIPNLPPGTYWVQIWHEALGVRRQPLVISPHGEATLTIEYSTHDLHAAKP